MKFIGIDYGTKRVGIAISDDEGHFAFPHSVLENNNDLMGNIKAICGERGVEVIVIGESLDYKKRENPIMEDIYKIKDCLVEETGLPVYLEPEFLTTQEAKRVQGKRPQTHASAAALILQSYIDKRRDSKV